MKKAKFGLGLVIGAAVGVIAGMLTAPKSGRETREDLKRRAEGVRDDAMDRIEDAKGKVRQATDDVKDRATDYKERAEKAVESARDELTDEPEHRHSKKESK